MKGIAAAVVVLASTLAWGMAPAQASCAPPELSVSPATGAPGDRVTLTGQYFFVGCNDTVQPGPVPGPPDQGIKVQFVQGARTVELGTANADAEFKFQQVTQVPGDATDGDAVFQAVGKNGTAQADFKVIVKLPLPTSVPPPVATSSTSTSSTSTSSTSTTFLSTSTTEESTTTTESSTTSTSTTRPRELAGKDDDDDTSLGLILGAVGGLVVVVAGLFLLFRRMRA